MHGRALGAALSAATVVLAGAGGRASAADGWSADSFVPSERGSRWFFAESLDLRGHGRMAIGGVGTYSYRSVAVRDAAGDVVASPVRNQAVLHIGASFVFHDAIRLGFDVPLQLASDGHEAVVDGVHYPPAADDTAVGDVRLGADVRLFGRHREGLTGAIGVQLFVPSGAPASFTGDGEPHLRPRFMLAYERRAIALSAMTGMHLRGRDEAWADGQIGSEAFVGVAGGVVLAQGRITVGPELLATTVVSAGAAFRTHTTPVEVLLGSRWELLPKIRLGAGAGAGLTEAYGAPVARALLSLEWTPDDPLPPPPPPEKGAPPDRDGDGVPDAEDACGFVPGESSPLPERNGCPSAAPAPAPEPAPRTRSRSRPGGAMIPALLLALPLAFAQIAPPGDQLPAATIKPSAASTGKTDIDASAFAAGNALQEEDEQYATEGSLSLGGLFASGNARTIALTTAAKLRLRRYEHQLSGAAAWNFARSAKKGDTAAETTVENYQFLGRYDLFLSPHVSLFLQSTLRRDRFQGLDLRVNADPGIAYHFIQTPNQRLIAEAGYDLQHDIRRDESRIIVTPAVAPETAPIITVADKTRTLHDLRLFLGYENKLYSEVSFIASLEHIQNFQNLRLYRLVFDTGLKSTIRGRLALAMTYTMRFENMPLPGVEKADSLAAIALVYSLF